MALSPQLLTFLGLGLGTLITFMSSHWLLAWMGLEISTLAMMPLMIQQHHPRAIEATVKYFITQSTGAAILLFASITNAWLTGQWDIHQMTHPFPTTLISLALAIKLGLAPFHFWLPEVLQGQNLTTGLLLSTWQKLAPFIVLLQLHHSNTTLLIGLGLASTILGGWGGLDQTQLRKILAYSSITHMGWIILVLQFNPTLALVSLLVYIGMTVSTFLSFKMTKSTNINSMASSSTTAPIVTALIPIILLSLAGLPPLTGFMIKWMILAELAKQDLAVTAVLAALTSLLSIFYYLRLSYVLSLVMSVNNPLGAVSWRLNTVQHTTLLSFTTTVTLIFLPMTPPFMALTPL
nr:NADH dehydrogenase subunit 2 [Heteropriacanthus cruentatus]